MSAVASLLTTNDVQDVMIRDAIAIEEMVGDVSGGKLGQGQKSFAKGAFLVNVLLHALRKQAL
jgi:hypothetical protein